MRRVVAFGLVLTLALAAPAAAFAAGRAAGKQDPPGTVKGDAKNANGEKLAQTKVRVRSATNGNVAAELTTDAAGTFTGSVPAGSYVVEIIGPNGAVIGLSPTFTVVAGTTATLSVTASAIAAVGAASAASGGVGILGLGTAATVGIVAAAGTAAIVGIKVAKNDASPAK